MRIKRLILPIERESRELESRKIIKKYFELRGFNVKLVNSVFFHTFFPFYRRAYVLENDLTFQSFKLLKNLFRCGFKIITHDEEAYGDVPIHFYFNTRFYINNFKYISHHFFKGDNDYNFFINSCETVNLEKVSIANNYRFLKSYLLNEVNENVFEIIEEKRKSFKKIILITSKFSYINRKDGDYNIDQIISRRSKKFNLTEAATKLCADHLNYSYDLFLACITDYQFLIKSHPDILFIIRSHPAENANIWHKNFSSFNNVIFDNTDKFISWAKYVDLIIHNGSTSGLEAFLLGKNVIYYNPLPFNEKVVCLVQKVSSLYVNDLRTLNVEILNAQSYNEDEYKNRIKKLENHVNLKNDFAEMIYSRILTLSNPTLNIVNRIKYIFSRLFLYRLRVYLRKAILNFKL